MLELVVALVCRPLTVAQMVCRPNDCRPKNACKVTLRTWTKSHICLKWTRSSAIAVIADRTACSSTIGYRRMVTFGI